MKIDFENVSFSYRGMPDSSGQALSDVSLHIDDHEFVGLLGPTGSGKTTLIQHLTGLLRPSSGQVFIDGQDLPIRGAELARLRRRIGLVFQFPETQLFEEKVWDDVAFGPRNLGLPDEEIKLRVRSALKQVDLNSDSISNRSPHRLSEGEKRRVALAGVLSMDPEVLALDEPSACLDPRGVNRIEQILRRLHQSGKTVILISHNVDLVFRLVDRIIILSKGRIVYDGTRDQLVNREDLLLTNGLDLPRISRFLKKKHYQRAFRSQSNLFSLDQVRETLGVDMSAQRRN